MEIVYGTSLKSFFLVPPSEAGIHAPNSRFRGMTTGEGNQVCNCLINGLTAVGDYLERIDRNSPLSTEPKTSRTFDRTFSNLVEKYTALQKETPDGILFVDGIIANRKCAGPPMQERRRRQSRKTKIDSSIVVKVTVGQVR